MSGQVRKRTETMDLEIILKPGSDTPIYEQIEEQIRAGVISGTLMPGTPIPSIRALAKMLRVSVITVQKAYENLKRQGYIESVVGRGTVIAQVSRQTLLETRRQELESVLEQAVRLSRDCGMDLPDLISALELMYKEESS